MKKTKVVFYVTSLFCLFVNPEEHQRNLTRKKVEHSNIENTFHNLLASVNNLPPEVQQCQAELLRNYSKMKLLYINSVLQLQ